MGSAAPQVTALDGVLSGRGYVADERRRSLGKAHVVDSTDTYRILQNMPFSH